MKVLVACEESQAVTIELRKLGHESYSCDIIPCSGGHDEWHIMQDVLPLLNGHCSFITCDGTEHQIDGKWDMIIAFPPCTHLSSSGQWAYSKGFKDVQLREDGANFFMQFANADCERIAIENPVGIMSTRFRKPDQIIHPWQFGHNAEKQTCLWLKGLSNLIPSTNEKPELEYFEWTDKRTGKQKRMQKWMYDIRCISDRSKRASAASKTFPGIAKAMAEQWAGENNNLKEKESKEMELKIKELALPESVEWNYQEVKEWVAEGIEKYSKYESMIMDADSVKIGKADRAELNKVKEALNKERIRQEKEYMKPFNVFKGQVNELIAMIDEPVKLIDSAVKGYEEEQKAQKEATIEAIFEKEAAAATAEIRLDKIWNDKWLNASVSLKKIQEEIHSRIEQFNSDIETLQNLPEFAFEAVETYLQTLDINTAIAEGKRLSDIQKRKAEAEAEAAMIKALEEKAAAETKAAENAPIEEVAETKESVHPDEPAKQWISFKALLTVAEAQQLRAFFEERNIQFKAV